jgi:squalene synthase HpnC
LTKTRPTYSNHDSPVINCKMNEQLVARERTVMSTPMSLPDTGTVLGQAGAENFPVASKLLPRSVRNHLLAVYGFARLADDIGDEAEGDRLALLGWLTVELERSARGQATHPLLQRLSATIRQFDLPLDPFQRLIEANRQDQLQRRYETFDDLVAYCRLSATPVGELVLRIFEVSTPARITLSDDVCIALQVIEHLQDVAEDVARDRIYIPQKDLLAFGSNEDELRASRTTPHLRTVLRYEAGRARRLLHSAAQLTQQLPLQPRIAVCGFAAGGMAALDAIESAGYEVLAEKCRPRPWRFGIRLVGALATASIKPVQ